MALVVVLFGVVVFPLTGIRREATVTNGPLEGLALSFVTFATLGYGNRTPEGLLGEALGGLEATSGALLISMFVVALATKYLHRG